jgi:hypothetical protein
MSDEPDLERKDVARKAEEDRERAAYKAARAEAKAKRVKAGRKRVAAKREALVRGWAKEEQSESVRTLSGGSFESNRRRH